MGEGQPFHITGGLAFDCLLTELSTYQDLLEDFLGGRRPALSA